MSLPTQSLFYVGTIALIVPMTLALVRSVLGPSTYDRISALNSFGTKTVLLIALTGFLFGRPEWLDLGVVYALMNFIGTLAVLRFSKYGSLASLGPVPDREDGTPAPPVEGGDEA